MKVTIDGEERAVPPGAAAASLLNEDQRVRAGRGEVIILDAWGHRVGVEGALAADTCYFSADARLRPPAVNACLEEWRTWGGAPIPAPMKTSLIRYALTLFRRAGGAPTARTAARFAANLASRRDAGALWHYLGGAKFNVAAFPGGAARVRAALPDLQTAVIALRDILTFRNGTTTLDYFGGVALTEVGTTNKVSVSDYQRYACNVDAFAAARAGDFAVTGFVAAPAAALLAAAARAAGKLFVSVAADVPLCDERGTPVRSEGDVAIYAAPYEAREWDFIFTAHGLTPPSADARANEAAAAALWDYFMRSGDGKS